MKRRTLILGGGVILASSLAGISVWPRSHKAIAAGNFSWKGTDFLSGGTKAVDSAKLPAPIFRSKPNCVVTVAQTLGPCHISNIPVRDDISEGKAGLPMRLAVRVVHASDCRPIKNADVEIWHTDRNGFYSGREMPRICSRGDRDAINSLAFRGRKLTKADGEATFLTIYPGWYTTRAPHIHCRIVVDGRELLISQLYFDDTLSNIVYSQHPDYPDGQTRNTNNTDDRIIPDNAADHIFDFEKLEGGILSATITIGLSS